MASSAVLPVKGSAPAAFAFTSNVAADDTVVIGTQTYTFKASVTTTANQVKVGADLNASIQALVHAINKDATGSGTTYGSATVQNPYVSASCAAAAATSISLAARNVGATVNGLYLAATAPGANDITPGAVTFGAVTSAVLGAGSLDAFVTNLFGLNQIPAELAYELNKLTLTQH